jgi:tRNA(Leu) C34 or U34 (ribose-2'-O)-methylase TrmL
MNPADVIIGLINPKSPDNVAAILRAAGNFRAGGVLYTGKRYPHAVQRNPATPNLRRKISQDIPLTGVTCLLDHVPVSMKVVCVEFAENAAPLPAFQHPDHAIYVFGPEDGTIGQDVIDRADAVVYIPTAGCMNLSASVTVVLYDRLSKSAPGFAGNELIRLNRDINNRLKVKSGTRTDPA